MAHEQEFNLKEHLQVMAAVFAIIGTIMAGMAASMMMLIFEGLLVSTSDKAFSGHDFGDYFGGILPAVILTFLVIEGLVAWAYFRYAKRVSQDPNNRFEL